MNMLLQYSVRVAVIKFRKKCKEILSPMLINQSQECKIKMKEQYAYTGQNSEFGNIEIELVVPATKLLRKNVFVVQL